MESEIRTVTVMIGIYCRSRHGSENDLCDDCTELLAYAEERIEKCPFGIDKPMCKLCTVHCYNQEMREKIREVMRFSGPRMILYHPVMAISHLIRSKQST